MAATNIAHVNSAYSVVTNIESLMNSTILTALSISQFYSPVYADVQIAGNSDRFNISTI